MEIDGEIEMDVMHRGQVRTALGHARQQFHFVDTGHFGDQRTGFFIEPAQAVGQCRTGEHFDRLAGEVRQFFRPEHVIVADDPLPHRADRCRVL